MVAVGALPTSVAGASPLVLFAASVAHGTGSCATQANACTLTTALADVVPGGTIELVTPGTAAHYFGTFTLSTGTAASPVTIAPASGVSDPILDGNLGASAGCPTTSCLGSVLTIAAGVGASVTGLTIEKGSTAPGTSSYEGSDGGNGGGIDNAGTLTLTDSTVRTNQTGPGGLANGVTVIQANGPGDSVTVKDVNGGNGGNGGGIYSTGTLLLADDTVADNQTGAGGGAGAITVTQGDGEADHQEVSQSANGGNGGNGGGIDSTGILTLANDTVAGNQTGAGGVSANVTLTQGNGDDDVVTVTGSGNGGNGGNGGGIDSAGTLTLTSDTVADNGTGAGGANPGAVTITQGTGSDDIAIESTTGATGSGGAGGGVFNSGTGSLGATIVADQTSGGSCAGVAATLTDLGYNIDDDGSCGFGGTSVSDSPTVDPNLGVLTSNGGPTQTIALLPNSPAIDKVRAVQCPATDQRGAPRTAPCDIGAYDTDFPSLVCPPGATYFLTATYATGTFYGVFCVNANGDGTYVQYSPGLPANQQILTGTGHIRTNQGVTSIQAYLPTFKNLNLVGTSNAAASSFGESGSGFPHLSGTFTLSASPPPTLTCPTPTGVVDTAYSSAFVAGGGTSPYSITFVSDSNPSLGLAGGPAGTVTGLPTSLGSTTITAHVTDSMGASTITSCLITIAT